MFPSPRSQSLTRGRVAWLQATQRRGAASALWLCLAAALALPALLLVLDVMAAESGLAETLNRDGGFTVRQDVASVDAFNQLGRQVDSRVVVRAGDALVPLGGSAALGPLRVLLLRADPAPAPLTRQPLTAVYAAHLAAHVTVVAGELPPEGLGGGEPAVSMPRADADRLDIRLSDRICGDFTTSQQRWCVRVVGLWTPIAADDPFWGGSPPRLQLLTGRHDLFQLAALGSPRPPTAAMRYWAAPDAATLTSSGALAARVAALAGDLQGPGRRVESQLAGSLRAFAGRQRAVSAAIHAQAVLVAVLGLATVALVAGRVLDAEARELALLRARGWSRARTWRVAFTGLGALGLSAGVAAVVVCALLAIALSVSSSGLSILTLRRSDVPGTLAAPAGLAAILVVLLALLSARAARREPLPSLRQPALRARPDPTVPAIAAGLAGVVALSLPWLPGTGAAAAAFPAVHAGLLAAPALGVVLLAAAAAIRPPVPWRPGGRSVHGVLAALQLRRNPGQHAGAAFALTLSSAAVVFAAVTLAAGPVATPAPLRVGLGAALAAGAAGGLLLALTGFGLHFRAALRRRLLEYGGLFAHGLPSPSVERSLAHEQVASGAGSLVTGALLGALLAPAVLAPPTPAGAVAGLAAAAATALSAAAAAWLSRRMPPRVDPLRLQREV